ncbi:helix-turn-helix transcriptional regulator [Novipirellula artificiosorum]|uniref:HTH-type transcriptional activator Btr n=1 Tax=Novipirellula artificiosorum TaxID=2528016 RepID=A0A5C6DUJ7_9BACT|nr:AraC family transcriptional regulator [Novipirellula artificiosorum]TWU39587.1 HTH-type transcriptional activator Btr [Novipirellula artificiosorum]
MKPKTRSERGDSPAPDFFSSDVAGARRFYLDLSPSEDRPLVVVCGGYEHCTPSYAICRDTFPFFSIEYVTRGRGNVMLDDRCDALQPGRLFSYGPNVSQRINGDPAQPMVKYFVDFSGTHALALLQSCGLKPGRISEVFPPNALQPLFDELIEAGSQAHRGSEELCAKLLECLVLRITTSRAPIKGSETLAFETFQRCRQHIQEHCLRLQSLDQIASECDISNAYLCRLFRRFDNSSPYQYMLRLKMNDAAERLQQPGALVKQVAKDCGFIDPFHFSRVFRSVFGISPVAFRRLR